MNDIELDIEYIPFKESKLFTIITTRQDWAIKLDDLDIMNATFSDLVPTIKSRLVELDTEHKETIMASNGVELWYVIEKLKGV